MLLGGNNGDTIESSGHRSYKSLMRKVFVMMWEVLATTTDDGDSGDEWRW